MEAKDIRNVALVGHGGAGKTALTEALLYTAGVISRMGNAQDGNMVSDFEPEEAQHKMSIATAVANFIHKDTKINLIDTPGFTDFIAEVKCGIKVADSALFVVSATGGVEVQTEVIWEEHTFPQTSKAIFVNKMDRENADFFAAIKQAQEQLSQFCVPVQLPIGSAENFKGIVDLINVKAYIGSDKSVKEAPVPEEMNELVAEYRDKLLDIVAEKDDGLLEKYLEGQEPDNKDILAALKLGLADGSICPVYCGTATGLIGTGPLTDAIVNLFPSAEHGITALADGQEFELIPSNDSPVCAFVFKTFADPFVGRLSLFKVLSGELHHDTSLINTAHNQSEKLAQLFIPHGKKQEPVEKVNAGDIGAVAKLTITHTNDTLTGKDREVTIPQVDFPKPIFHEAIYAQAKADEEKLSTSLTKLLEEDPTVKINRNPVTHETIVSGMGEIQLDVLRERLKRKYGVESYFRTPKISYRETIAKKIKVQGKYKKQSGGRGQYGDCWIEVEPLERGKEFEFVDKIFGGSIPQSFRPAVEKGILEAMHEGIIAKSPVVDLKVTLVDGTYHPVDSSEMAFKIAGSMALKAALQQAGSILLEPIDNIEVVVPESMVGDIIGDLNSRRGKVQGMEPIGEGKEIIRAQIPEAELTRYSIELRSITGGRAKFTRSFSHYNEVPAQFVDKVAKKIEEEREIH